MFDVTYGGAMVAGLLSFLSPCILPIVPFYLCFLAGISMGELQGSQTGNWNSRRRIILATVFFALGIITVFMGLGATATIFGQALRSYFGVLRYVAGGIVILLGMHFIGILRIPLLYRQARIDTQQNPVSLMGAYIVGLAFAFGWTPCVGPVLAAVLFAAGAQETAWQGASLLLVYGLGMTLPFVIAAVFASQFLGFMSRFRKYFGLVEKLMGVLLIMFGLLIITGRINVIANWMLSVFPSFQTLG